MRFSWKVWIPWLVGLIAIAALGISLSILVDRPDSVEIDYRPGRTGDWLVEGMDNTKVRYQCTGSYCGEVSYPSADYTAGETLAWPQLCVRSGTDNKIYKAAAGTRGLTAGEAMIVVSGCGADATTCEFLLDGQINYASWSFSGDTAYFASTPAAVSNLVLSGTRDQVRIAGYPIDSNSLRFKPGETIIEIE